MKSTTNVHQGLLQQHIKTIFSNVEAHVNVHKPLNIRYPSTGGYLEFDVWLPDLNLCFEFQDSHHYTTTWYYQNGQDNIRHIDDTKKILAHQKELSLIAVPCWWDGSLESLESSINFARPDLVPSKSTLIPLNPPEDYFRMTQIPGVGELMLASFPNDIKVEISPCQLWWAGEKFDGMRFCYNPDTRQIYSRQGKEVALPDSLYNSLPAIFIDGEFWFGRGQYPSIYMLVNSSQVTPWHFLRAIAFDVPSGKNPFLPLETRYDILFHSTPPHHPLIIAAARILAENHAHFKQFLQGVITEEGEGLILHRHGSLFEPGRTKLLLKIKTVQVDREGVVVRVAEDKSVLLKLPNGKMITVPAKDVEVPTPLTGGDVVTFSFEVNARRDLPVNSRIYRIRTDVSWPEIVQNYKRDQRYLSDSSQVAGFKSQPLGHWTKKTMRELLEAFVRTKGLDPLVPATWYNKSVYDSVCRSKKGRAIIHKCKGGYGKTIQYLFSELHFDPTKFQKNWSDIRIRRRFFENYAKNHSFDPQNAENWHNQSVEAILGSKGASRVIGYHDNNVAKALTDLFPNIGLDKSKFADSQSILHYAGNRRRFFENYARDHGFDPLVADNWYSQPPSRFLSLPGGKSVLVYYKYSVPTALLDLFPNIGLRKSKFMFYWRESNNRRRFFEEYAKEEGFNPLSANDWYAQPLGEIMSFKDASRVMFYHGNSAIQALIDLFPEIGLQKSRFHSQYVKHDVGTLRTFFEQYAKDNDFDPLLPENWYRQPTSRILYTKGARGVKTHYQGSVPKALRAVFPNINLEISKFNNPRQDFIMERRKFFENYAKEHHFDPLLASNWYRQPIYRIMEFTGATKVLAFYRSSVPFALMSLFPDIGLDASQFQSSWKNVASRRRFFVNYAKANEFDPLISENWYSQSRSRIESFKGASTVIGYHDHSIPQALIDLFPEVGFNKTKFKYFHNTWQEPENRKLFFTTFAQEKGFQITNVEKWYNQPLSGILSSKGAKQVLQYHNNSLSTALTDLFPNLNFDLAKFSTSTDYSLP